MKRIIPARLITFASNQSALIALIILVIITVSIFPSLLSLDVLKNTLSGYSMVGIVSMGMTFVILSGGIDLSVGSIAAVAGYTAAFLTNRFVGLTILVPILVGGFLGALNGVVVTKLKVPPFLATLAMQMAARGASLIISGEKPLPLKAPTEAFLHFGQGEFLGLSNYIWIFMLVAVICIVVSRWTRFGRKVYAVGSNEEAAKMLGFNVNMIKIFVYTISGVCAGLSGLMLTAHLFSAQNTAGQGWELTAITAVVIGGTHLTGGKGKFSGTIYGVYIYAVIEILLGRFNMMVWWINIVTGVLLLAVISMQRSRSIKHAS